MKDDLVQSKKDSLSRLEQEWKKRKASQDRLWLDRMIQIQKHTKLAHTHCLECTQLFQFIS
jgi:hypothetical protein